MVKKSIKIDTLNNSSSNAKESVCKSLTSVSSTSNNLVNTDQQLVLLSNSNKMSGDQKTMLKGNCSQYVKLNVGGILYYTTIGTLTKNNENMLSAMFSGRMEVLTDSEGIFITQE